MIFSRCLAIMIAFSAVPVLRADILHLRDGSRHYGELIAQNEQEVVFRIVHEGRGAAVVRRFPAATVERVERTSRREAVSTPAGRPTSAPATAEDYEQMLREAFELLDDQDFPAALRALQRVALGAPQKVLRQLEEQCRAARGVPLDELLAQTRLRVTRLVTHERQLGLTYATPYERAALGRFLAEQQRELLGRQYEGRTVAAWVESRTEYTEVGPAARQIVADAGRAAAIVAARLRYDPQLGGNRAARASLVGLREDLSRLAAHILALPGYTTATERGAGPDPTEAVAEQLAAAAAATQPVDANPAEDPDRVTAEGEQSGSPHDGPTSKPVEEQQR